MRALLAFLIGILALSPVAMSAGEGVTSNLIR